MSTNRRRRLNLEDDTDTRQELFNDRNWEWDFFREKFVHIGIERHFQMYMDRLRLSYLPFFVALLLTGMSLHSVLLLKTAFEPHDVCFDIFIYMGTSVVVSLILCANLSSVLSEIPHFLRVTSWLSVIMLLVPDVLIPLHEAEVNQDYICTFYDTLVILSVYMGIPIQNNLEAVSAGILVSICYLFNYAFLSMRKQIEDDEDVFDVTAILFVEPEHKYADFTELPAEAVYYICLNIIGIYFRLMRETSHRSVFWNRREIVEESIRLRKARLAERTLLLSIIPEDIADRIESDVKSRVTKYMKTEAPLSVLYFWRMKKLFMQPHEDVTILYADMVNYTHLTTTLDVKTLVETLHKLYTAFDRAAEHFNVQRIKFLGDCYYCVAGMRMSMENHAKSAVDLGLQMIVDIRNIRDDINLNIDMRIGVHSGNVLSGVIGACKWQFDIWSKDVDIASRLEQTGLAGRVHVSKQTLSLLEDEYLYEDGTESAKQDDMLVESGIITYLIISLKVVSFSLAHESNLDAEWLLSPSLLSVRSFRYSTESDQSYYDINKELEKIPILTFFAKNLMTTRRSRFRRDTEETEFENMRNEISIWFLFFKNWRWEVSYLMEPDVFFKYNVALACFSFITICIIQILYNPYNVILLCVDAGFITIHLILLFFVWYKKIWLITTYDNTNPVPTNFISSTFFRISHNLQYSVWQRVTIYLLIVLMHSLSLVSELSQCSYMRIENELVDELLQGGVYKNKMEYCPNPWGITHGVILTICIIFLFANIPFILKTILATFTFFYYFIFICFEYDYVFEKSATTNIGLYSEYSHTFVIFLVLLFSYAMDRQTEFVSKVNYSLRRLLKSKKFDGEVASETIMVLTHNILPEHVAQFYMKHTHRNELFYEEYDNVAVMFASVKNLKTTWLGIRFLNELICEFDEVLQYYMNPLKVEKIKVIGWTYMACCGLAKPQRKKTSTISNVIFSQFLIDSMAHNEDVSSIASDTKSLRKKRTNPMTNVVYVMVQFALDLMRSMYSFNADYLQYDDDDGTVGGQLRIGISNGEVMAGVVGFSRPHYDIWGNPVNIASRMDSTGIPGKIQITEEAAEILASYDIKSTFRSEVFVKGIGNMPTYFVDIDDNFNLMDLKKKSYQH